MISKADLKSKEGNSWLSLHSSYPIPTSFPEKLSEESATVRSRTSLHQTEISHQVSAMAGAVLLGPSLAPYLVESSTAHDGHLSLVSTSRTGDFKLLTFSSEASSPALNPQPASFPPSEMLELLNQLWLQSGRRANTNLSPIGKLGFPLVGLPVLGPLSLSSPSTKDDPQILHKRLSRFDWNPILSHPSQSQYSFMKPFVRRLHLDNKLLLVLGWLEIFLDNLLLESSRTLAFEASNLNELGIMIQSIWNCGYRCVFMLPSSTRLIHKPIKLPLINFLKFPLKNLKTNGIMIPIQCSGGYHNISKRFKPEPKTTTNLITIFKQSIINHVQTLDKALLRVDVLNPVRFLALAFSTLRSLRSKTVAIFSSIEVFMEETSLFLDLTGSKTLARSWFIALKSTISMTLIYLYLFVVLALGNALPCCSLNSDLYVVCCVLF